MGRLKFAASVISMMGALLAGMMFGLHTRSVKAARAAAAQVPGAGSAADLPATVQIEPGSLAKLLQESKGEKPVILHVGFKNFYEQARIPGSGYAGPGAKSEGLELLRKRVDSLPRKQFIVLYCGCCPWDKCPNIKPAYEALRDMGFTNVKVAHMAQNFGANWVNTGLPVTKGE